MCSVGEDCQKSLLNMKHYHSSTDFGLYKVEEKNNGIVCWLKCALVFIGLSSVLLVILHFTINTTEETEPLNNSTDHIKQSEKFVSAPLPTNIPPTALPEPFDLKPSGLHPHRFIPTSSKTPPTTLRTPFPRYPQLTNYRHHYYPHNVREVIRYMTEGPKRLDTRRMTGRTKTSRFVDPLQQYKPNDPSEVNLLATGDFRFAPPAWKDFQRSNQVRQNISVNLRPPDSSLMGNFFLGSVTRDAPRFHHQAIPLDNAASTNVDSASGMVKFPPLLRYQQSGRGSLEEMLKKPFMVTLSVYPGMGQTLDTKPPMVDFGALPEESVGGTATGGATPMHVSLKVFPSLSYSAVHHR